MKFAFALIFLISTSAYAGSSVVIGVEGPTTPYDQVIAANFQAAAADYLARNPDVASVYGAANYQGAWQHYQQYGQREGRAWNQSQTKIIFGYCGDHGQGGTGNGNNCVHFPNGGDLTGIAWQSAVKIANTAVLWVLYTSDGRQLLSTIQTSASPSITRDVRLTDPIVIAPGGFIWIYADGYGDQSAGGIEAQTALYFNSNPMVTQ